MNLKKLFKKEPPPVEVIYKKVSGHVITQQKLDELDKKLGERTHKMLVEEFGDVHKFLTMIRLEHKAMKKLMVKKGICEEKEIQKEAEIIRG